jgi:hypothetical protein
MPEKSTAHPEGYRISFTGVFLDQSSLSCGILLLSRYQFGMNDIKLQSLNHSSLKMLDMEHQLITK